ncbi:MAG: sulfurtransferase [Blastochloris sp.]|nr:sulfurtransferase [Blastochloris sp.]
MKHSPAFQQLCETARRQIQEITPELALARLESGQATLIDVREDHEVSQGRIRGAHHLGRGILERDVENQFPDKDQELILYCGGGYRSALSALNLQTMGYTKILSLAGGWRSWNEKALPTDPGPSS